MTPMIKNVLWLLGGLAGPLAAGAATPANNVPSVAVKYSEQSLATDDGVNALYRRIAHAAEQVCPDAVGGGLSALQRQKTCRSEAVDRAIRQINNARLLAVEAARARSG